MTYTFTLGQLIAVIGGLLVIFGSIAGTVIWLYATFITRTEAAKLEQACQQFIEAFKQVFDEKLHVFKDEIERLKKNKRRHAA